MRAATTAIGIADPQTVRTIGALQNELLQALKKHETINLKLQDDVDVDLTFVQLVEAARRFAAAKGKTIALTEPASNALRDVLERGGFLTSAEPRAFWLHEKGEG